MSLIPRWNITFQANLKKEDPWGRVCYKIIINLCHCMQVVRIKIVLYLNQNRLTNLFLHKSSIFHWIFELLLNKNVHKLKECEKNSLLFSKPYTYYYEHILV